MRSDEIGQGTEGVARGLTPARGGCLGGPANVQALASGSRKCLLG